MSYLDKANVSGTVYDLGKPLYFHGIDLYHSVTKNAVTVSIINTDGTQITTISQFKSWAEGISGTVTVPCNGCDYINGEFKHCYMLRKNADNTWAFFYNDSSGYNSVIITLEDEFNQIVDNFNKIN